MRFFGINFLLILIIAGVLNLLVKSCWGNRVVSLELIPEALVGWPAVAISIVSFLLIVWLKREVALVAVVAMAGGVVYAGVRALT